MSKTRLDILKKIAEEITITPEQSDNKGEEIANSIFDKLWEEAIDNEINKLSV